MTELKVPPKKQGRLERNFGHFYGHKFLFAL